jgi:hypothetical protein
MEAADHGKEDEDVAALVLFRQVIEMADGVGVHVACGCGTAAIPVIRSQSRPVLDSRTFWLTT